MSKKVGRTVTLVVVGLLIGFVNGYLGAGGGMLLVPLLSTVAGLNERNAHATAIATILPTCIASAAIYAQTGALQNAPIASVVGGVVLGGAVGAVLLKYAGNKALSTVFYLVMILAGLKMLI